MPGYSAKKLLASWEKAVEIYKSRLTDDEKKKFEQLDLNKAEFWELSDTAESLQEKIEASRFSWTPKLHEVIKRINDYAVVGDLIIQHHAEYTSLVWGAFRFVLMFAEKEHRVSETIAKGLDKALGVMLRAQFYANLFSEEKNATTAKVFERLQKDLTYLYAEVLNFMMRSTLFLKQGSFRFSSDTALTKSLDDLRERESDVDKDKSALESDSRKRSEDAGTGQWLNAADFKGELGLRQTEFQEGTCKWLLDRSEYVSFRKGANEEDCRLLWIVGKPGCGKSVLAAQIVKDLCDVKGNVVVYVLCKSGQRRKDSLDAILCNLIFQLLRALPEQAQWYRDLLVIREREQKDASECGDSLWGFLESMLQGERSISLVLDAIDECKDTQDEQYRFLERLAKSAGRNPNARIALTSRLPYIGSKDHVSWTAIRIEPLDSQADIERVVAKEFQKSTILAALPEKERLQRTIIEKSDGMILWAKLVMHELEANQWDPDSALDQLPHDLYALYDTILGRILTHDPSRAKIISLRLVLAARRALRVEELAMAVAVGQGLKRHEHYDVNGEPQNEVAKIVHGCNPLLISTPCGHVQVLHATLRQYLLEASHLSQSFQPSAVHRQMATVLMKYMAFDCFTAAEGDVPTPKHYLIEYATRNLVHHCEHTTDKETPTELARFFETAPGWKWGRRLINVYNVPAKEAATWQFTLASWSVGSDAATAETLQNFLLVIVEKQAKAMEQLPKDSLVRADALRDKAFVYRLIGRLQDSKILFEEVLSVRRQKLENPHYLILEALSNLAAIARQDGRWREAIDVYRPLIKDATRLFGETDNRLINQTDIALAMDREALASVYISQDWLSDAEDLLREVIVAAERREDGYHELLSYLNLASVLQLQDRWEESTKVFDKVLERTSGAKQDEVLALQITRLQANQAEFEGSYDRSEQLHLERIERMKNLDGDTHPQTLGAHVARAEVLMRQMKWEDAEQLLVPTRDTYQKVLRANHPASLVCEARLATVHVRIGHLQHAEEALSRLITATLKELGDEHIETILLQRELANLRAAQARHSEAESLLSEVLADLERVRGKNHRVTLDTMYAVALNRYGMGNTMEAIEMMGTVVERRKSLLGPKHPDTTSAEEQLEQWKGFGEGVPMRTARQSSSNHEMVD